MRLLLGATPQQREVIESASPVRVLVAGRRFGKTVCQQFALADHALRNMGHNCLFVSPSYSQSKSVYKAMLADHGFGRLVRRRAEQPAPNIELFNGSALYFRSADKPDLLRGGGTPWHFIAVDEARDMSEQVYQSVIVPMSADKRAPILLASTFRGTEHWLYRLWRKGQDAANHASVRSWLYPTRLGPAFQSTEGKARLEQIRASVPEAVWLQEFECDPLADDSAVFPARHLDACTTNDKPPRGPESARWYILGWDIGRVADPSALVVMDSIGRVVVAEAIALGTDYSVQLDRAARLASHWRALVVCDTTGTNRDAILDLIRQRIPGVRGLEFRKGSKETYCNQLALALERRSISIPSEHAELLRQLRIFRRKACGTYTQFSAPPNEHDDMVAALLMAWHAREQGWASASGLPLASAMY